MSIVGKFQEEITKGLDRVLVNVTDVDGRELFSFITTMPEAQIMRSANDIVNWWAEETERKILEVIEEE